MQALPSVFLPNRFFQHHERPGLRCHRSCREVPEQAQRWRKALKDEARLLRHCCGHMGERLGNLSGRMPSAVRFSFIRWNTPSIATWMFLISISGTEPTIFDTSCEQPYGRRQEAAAWIDKGKHVRLKSYFVWCCWIKIQSVLSHKQLRLLHYPQTFGVHAEHLPRSSVGKSQRNERGGRHWNETRVQ